MSAHILVVDDEAPTRELLSLFLTKKGFSVSSGMNVSQGKALAEKTRFDLAILDVDLAGENGLELLQLFKKAYPKMPVIIFTGLGADESLLEKVKAGGADGFVRKSDSLGDLFEHIVRHVPRG